MKGTFIGTRIRERRRQLGFKQTALASAAGISASYLNLIEHNRRAVSGRVLLSLANELDIPAAELSGGAETALVEELRQVLGKHPEQDGQTRAVEEFVGRFPQWARIVASQSRQIRDNEAAISTFSDRQNFDPHLQNTLHEMLTTITAIRSSSAILTTEEDLSPEQQSRFQSMVHGESRRLSDAAHELVSYFDQARKSKLAGTSSQEAFETFLSNRDHVFEELEGGDEPNTKINDIIGRELKNAPADAITRARDRMTTYAQDASRLPLEEFFEQSQKLSFAPDKLAGHFGVDIHAVFRRLASLRRNTIDAPNFGLVIINAAGQPKFRRPLREFSLPRFSTICALWPVFQALSQPEQPIRETIMLPNGSDFLAQAIAISSDPTQFGNPRPFSSGMLVCSSAEAYRFGMLDGVPRQSRDVGTSCRLCQRDKCSSRSEPSILPS